jgi:hypothetical protein
MCHYSRDLLIIMLNVIKLNVVMLSVVVPSTGTNVLALPFSSDKETRYFKVRHLEHN